LIYNEDTPSYVHHTLICRSISYKHQQLFARMSLKKKREKDASFDRTLAHVVTMWICQVALFLAISENKSG
jgi:hypothetical protein